MFNKQIIGMLIKYMYLHYEKKVMLFIDEYDVPIQESYNKGYYNKMISFMQIMLTVALKDNNYLEKSMVTGILRIAKESIFSGLNNLQVHTIFSYKFNDKFGFTEDEVEDLLTYYDLKHKFLEVKKWYNGYDFGGKTIYNPWSVLSYIDNSENLWSFLCLSGYLKPVKTELIEGELYCTLKIPNKEVLIFYKNLIEKWFKETLRNDKYMLMLSMLTEGEIEIFAGLFSQFVMTNLSYFDVSGSEPEMVYHAFVLGMLVSLSEHYEVKSNKESVYGRYDVMIIPKDKSKRGIIIEFKKIDDFLSTTIDEGIIAALKQIEDKNYEDELKVREINDIIKLAIVFKGKEVKVVQG